MIVKHTDIVPSQGQHPDGARSFQGGGRDRGEVVTIEIQLLEIRAPFQNPLLDAPETVPAEIEYLELLHTVELVAGEDRV